MGVYAMLSYLCYCNSDGRVSDGTKELIRRLIVLEPELRLTASQVLDALSTIIASNRPIYRGEELQVFSASSLLRVISHFSS